MKEFKKYLGAGILVLGLLFSGATIWAEEKLGVKETIETYKFLAEIYNKQKNFEKVIETYEKAVKLAPEDKELHESLARIYREQKIYEKAILEYRKLIEINSENRGYYEDLAKCYFELGKKGDASATLNKYLLEVKPDDSRAYWGIGCVYKDNGMFDEAIGTYKKGIELEPGYYRLHYDLAGVYKKQGKFDEAIEEYKKVLELTDQNYFVNRARSGIIELYEKQGRLDELAEELEKRVRKKVPSEKKEPDKSMKMKKIDTDGDGIPDTYIIEGK